MVYATFSHRNSSNLSRSAAVDVPATVTWNLPITGQPGSASLRLPLDSAALDSDFIDPDGGSSVHVWGDGNLGDWSGYVTGLDEGPGGITITATEWWGRLFKMPVAFNRKFRHVSPAIIVEQALNATPWGLSAAAETGPDIMTWIFNGETAWDHIQRMQEMSGAELVISGIGSFRWGRQTTSIYGSVLVAPQDLVNARFQTDAANVAGQVTVLSGDEWYTATRGDADHPAHVVVKENLSQNAMAARAENELNIQQEPIRTLSAEIAQPYWDISMGQSFAVYVPYARLGDGQFRTVRMVSRTYDDSRLTLQAALQITTENPLAGVPVPTGGTGSRFVQMVRRSEREAFRGRRYLSEETG